MNKRYGNLVTTSETKQVTMGKRRRLHIKCLCDCGNTTWIRKDSLQRGNTKSCGCLQAKQNKINLTANHRHKLSGTKIWHAYYSMKSRCYIETDKRYNNYGGRGIKVCDEWFNSFDKFADWALENKLEGNLQIDRIDNDKGYSPENCRVVTAKENSRNRGSNVMVEHEGKMITIAEKAEKLDIPYKTAYSRYRKEGTKRVNLNK